MKKTLILTFLLGFFFVSCKKDDSNSTNSGSNSGGAPIFFSFNNGDSWNYRTDSANVTLSQFTLTSTNRDTTAYSKSFHIFESNDGTTTTQEYYNISGNSYYQLATLTTLLPTLQLKYLETTAAVNSFWDTTINTIIPIQTYNFNLSAKVRQTVEQTNASIVVNGTLYDSVYKMKTEILNANASTQIQILPAPLPATTINVPISIIQNIHSYYAPRVGQIKRDYAINATADLSSLSALSTTIPDSLNLINTNRTTILLNSNIQ
jgi:hypothetical protein